MSEAAGKVLVKDVIADIVFQQTITHAPDFDGATMEMKTSKRGKYLSVTCVIRATSRQQLDDLYRALCDHPMVVMVL